MGLSSSVNKINNKTIPHKITNNYFEAYKSMEFILRSISTFKNCTLKDIFLISTKSIPIFINNIEKSLILENLKKNNFKSNENSEKILNDLFQKYTLEKNIVFYKDYQICKQLIGKNEENQFIIVDESFLTNMKFNFKELNKFRYYKVILNISTDKNNNNKTMKIKFPISNKTLYIQEKKFGFFKFIDNFNDNNNENEIKKSFEEIEINTIVSNNNVAIQNENIKRSVSNNDNNRYNKLINESKKKLYLDCNQSEGGGEKKEESNNNFMNYNNNNIQFNQQNIHNNNFYKSQNINQMNNNFFYMNNDLQNPINFLGNNINFNNNFMNNNF